MKAKELMIGDWVINRTDATIMQIVNNKDFYESVEIGGQRRTDTYNYVEWDFRLWTIEDAKEGDVLSYVTDEEDLWIMIYWSLYEPYEGHVHYHALLVNDNFSDKGTCCICINDLKPATKEQRDTLFAKMKEAGYEWDNDKKELKKIEQKPKWTDEDEENFQHCLLAIKHSKIHVVGDRIELCEWLEQLKERVTR